MESYREKADTLVKRFGISPIEAMKAIEECDGDILDAVSLLECKGIIRRTSASYNSENKTSKPKTESNNTFTRYGFDSSNNIARNKSFSENAKDILLNILHILISYNITVSKDDKKIISLPIIAVLALMCVTLGLVIGLAVIGLLAGCRFEITK